MSEDCFVDELFAGAVTHGAPLIAAQFPRAYLDVNREPYELDPEMFEDLLPDFVNTSSARVAGGLGTVARIVSEGEEIYRQKLLYAEAEERINALHIPYHQNLAELIDHTYNRFGTALLIDGHSMPSKEHHQQNHPRADFVLGDRCGNSCAPQVTDFFVHFLKDSGFSVTCNQPYAGGYITERYGVPEKGRHALQVEINRALYMDELSFIKNQGAVRLQNIFNRMFQELTLCWPDLIGNRKAAAE